MTTNPQAISDITAAGSARVLLYQSGQQVHAPLDKAVKAGAGTQTTATWEAGTGTTESLVSPAKVRAAIAALSASDTVAGVIEIATAGEVTTGTDTTRAVTPGRQHKHESAVKAWCGYNGVSNGIFDSYNISSVTDNGTGDFTFNFASAFVGGANYVGAGIAENNANEYVVISNAAAPAASAYRVNVLQRASGAVIDTSRLHMLWAGSQ